MNGGIKQNSNLREKRVSAILFIYLWREVFLENFVGMYLARLEHL